LFGDLLFGLTLRMRGAAENEKGCEADCRFNVTVHVFSTQALKTNLCWLADH
jgi:hypothetical protein